MGTQGSGKTSMRSIIFADYLAQDTRRLQATIDVEVSSVAFLGNLHLHLWDCGGQEDFYRNYLESMRDHIFRSVELLVYVFDIAKVLDMGRFQEVMDALAQHSSDAKVFVLLHKMDLVPEAERQAVFAARENDIHACCKKYGASGPAVRCFPSSIWDETLYRAWSQIVHSLVPNTRVLEEHLSLFNDICGADEVVIFESTTFLVIAHCEEKRRDIHSDAHRFEKISNIIKQFKLSCRKVNAKFHGMMVQNSIFTAFFSPFTANTCVMVIVSNPKVEPDAITSNIEAARSHFSAIIPTSTGGGV